MAVQVFWGAVSYIFFVLATILLVIGLSAGFSGRSDLDTEFAGFMALNTLCLYAGAFTASFFARK